MISDIALTEEALSLHPLSKRLSFAVFDAEGQPGSPLAQRTVGSIRPDKSAMP
jgi:hypothetical protein